MKGRVRAWLLMRLGIMAFALAATLALVSACGGGGDGNQGEPTAPEPNVHAVTSLEVFADMVRNVGGDRVDVKALLPPGADVHTYEMPPDKVAEVARADIVFINGLDLERSIQDVVSNNATGPVIELAQGLPTIKDDQQYTAEDGGGDTGGANPHLWLDVRLAARYVERIRDELSAIDPTGSSVYEANATAYLEKLGDLDREIEETVLTIPEQNRKLVTFHDAYPYLASRYGLAVVGVVVPSPGQEPSAQAVADLVRTLKNEHVPAAFSEPQFNSEVLDQAASEAGVQVYELLSDAYADDVDSYISLMHFNLDQLVKGLGSE